MCWEVTWVSIYGWSTNLNTLSTKASNNSTEVFFKVFWTSIFIGFCCNSLNKGCSAITYHIINIDQSHLKCYSSEREYKLRKKLPWTKRSLCLPCVQLCVEWKVSLQTTLLEKLYCKAPSLCVCMFSYMCKHMYIYTNVLAPLTIILALLYNPANCMIIQQICWKWSLWLSVKNISLKF